MSNNTPETMTERQRYRQKWLEKVEGHYKENKYRLQKMAHDWYKTLFEKKKLKKRVCEKLILEYVWRRQPKNKEYMKKNAKKLIKQCVEGNKIKLWLERCRSRCSN